MVAVISESRNCPSTSTATPSSSKPPPAAYKILETSVSVVEKSRERNAMKELREWCRAKQKNAVLTEDISSVLRLLLATALRWSDLDSIIQAVSACDPSLEYHDTYLSLYEMGNPRLTIDMLSEIVNSCNFNQARYQFVSKVASVTTDHSLSLWCDEQRGAILRSLRPCFADEAEWLICVAKEWGFPFFRDVIFPQLSSQYHDINFRKALAAQMVQAGDSFPYAAAEDVVQMIKELGSVDPADIVNNPHSRLSTIHLPQPTLAEQPSHSDHITNAQSKRLRDSEPPKKTQKQTDTAIPKAEERVSYRTRKKRERRRRARDAARGISENIQGSK
ncbi:hypothetical protein VNI00_009415 [Paramarasmius palmivorus]|uniref:Uncharacterized protein n=1 Tax=Paramarasmius palmivorus TaxID=297713 RepID=A0AAW0CLV5_9AGAR